VALETIDIPLIHDAAGTNAIPTCLTATTPKSTHHLLATIEDEEVPVFITQQTDTHPLLEHAEPIANTSQKENCISHNSNQPFPKIKRRRQEFSTSLITRNTLEVHVYTGPIEQRTRTNRRKRLASSKKLARPCNNCILNRTAVGGECLYYNLTKLTSNQSAFRAAAKRSGHAQRV
jgi:excinuclease UvrABC nuclease subunit